MRWIILALCILSLPACSSRPVPRGIILPDEMQKIIYDLVRTDEFINGYAVKDSSINAQLKRSTMYGQVFALHHTSREDFYKSYNYYQEHPDKHKIVLDSLNAFIIRKRLDAEKPRIIKQVNLTKRPQ